jgi:signal peptidase
MYDIIPSNNKVCCQIKRNDDQRGAIKLTKTLKTVWNIFFTLLVVAVVIIAALLVGVRVIGLRPFTVLSGSMEPVYHVGSLIYVQEVEPETIRVGYPITFVLNEDLVVATHRVVRIDLENSHFYTKGDANENEDAAPVHFKNLIGRPLFTVPYLGYLANFLETSRGRIIAVTAVVALVVLVFLPDMLKSSEKKHKGEQPEKAGDKEAETDLIEERKALTKPVHARKKADGIAVRRTILLCLIGLIIALTAIGGTLAWLTASTESAVHAFKAGSVSCAVEENVSNGVKQYVRIKNTGNVDAYIRAMLVPVWRDSQGNGTGMEAEAPAVTNSSWIKQDSFYYYTGAVPPGGYTSDLLTGFVMPSKSGYTYELQILASAIQATGIGAAGPSEAWSAAASY